LCNYSIALLTFSVRLVVVKGIVVNRFSNRCFDDIEITRLAAVHLIIVHGVLG